MRLALKALSEGHFPDQVYRFSDEIDSYSIGRSEENRIVVRETTVSSQHARIEKGESGNLILVDGESSNGTFVNGDKITRHTLELGDLVKFSSAAFRIIGIDEGEKLQAEADAEVQLALVNKELAAVTKDAQEKGQTIRELERELEEARASVATLNEKLQKATEHETSLNRELRELEGREEKLKTDLKSGRSVELNLEGKVATLTYELTQREEALCQKEREIDEVNSARGELQRKSVALEEQLEEKEEALEHSSATKAKAFAQMDAIVQRVRELSDRFTADWKYWLDLEDGPVEVTSEDEAAVFSRFEEIREKSRKELDLIEPIWKKFGQRVQDELSHRCEDLQARCDETEEELKRKQDEREGLGKDLLKLRRDVDKEVRRAQGLSRRGVEVEIPERFESMVIARDGEQRIYQDLIEAIESFERLIESYRKSRKLRLVADELEQFRLKLHRMLEEHGVRSFELPPGTDLTPRHRKEAQILGKKGWGTKEFTEKPFQPGEIVKVVRAGYRAGEGEGAVILRKVEVLIREGEV